MLFAGGEARGGGKVAAALRCNYTTANASIIMFYNVLP